MRPLSSLLHTLDYELWPHSAFLMHLHNWLWFALFVALVMKAYARLIESRWVMGVASAMFALDNAHGNVVGWISNRNALVCGVFGSAALLLHDRRRRGGNAWWIAAAAACFALALVSGEIGIGIAGYLASYALLYERGPLRARLLSLAPYALITALWAVLRSALGYGSFGTGWYLDPVKEPIAFLEQAPAKLAVLLSSQIGRMSADIYLETPPPLQSLLLVAALLTCAVSAWFAWPSLWQQRALRFWAGGALLALLPLCATQPNDRLLVLVGIGVMPVLAQAIHDALHGLQLERKLGFARAGTWRVVWAACLLVAHFVYDPLVLPVSALMPGLFAYYTHSADAGLPADPTVRDRTVIVAQVPESGILSYVPVERSVRNQPRPQELYTLAASRLPTRVERHGNTLRMVVPDGFFDRRWEARSPRLPMYRGERIALREMTVEVVDVTADGRPRVCDFHFKRPLDSERYVWRIWRKDKLVPLSLPRDGESMTLQTG
jgi:hypothetical protein